MELEDPIAALADLGITPNAGITVDDVLLSFSREEFESKLFDLLLFALGVEVVEHEPWGQCFSGRAWNFDTESVDEAHAHVVRQLSRIEGDASR